jgi:hypothetical protein
VVRASARNVGTCRPVVAVGSLDHLVPPTVARETPKQRELQGAEYRCGAQGRTVPWQLRSPVMRVERRGRVVRARLAVNHRGWEEPDERAEAEDGWTMGAG